VAGNRGGGAQKAKTRQRDLSGQTEGRKANAARQFPSRYDRRLASWVSGFRFPISGFGTAGAFLLPRLRTEPQPRRMDKLEEIFQMQDALNRRIGVNLPPATEEEKAKWILNYTRALQQETAELIDSVPWKWWAKYQKFDEQNAKVEVVDLFHFLVSLAQTLGMTADDVYQAYLKKNAVNHARQETGYAKKDEADSKHI
jgi:dimeric dUTPase (all-alpha-NTP-PPase superfamily)